MNFPPLEALLGRQRNRQWSPLITQQLRLRHVSQIIGYNFASSRRPTSYYYTLHSTSMSAPFYTSEKVTGANPKWSELDRRKLFSDSNSSSTSTVVLRIWQQQTDDNNEMDRIVLTWGINFSGLVYLGNKIADIQPIYFHASTVIFSMSGGYFTSHHVIRMDAHAPFIKNVNIVTTEDCTKVFRSTAISSSSSSVLGEVHTSYNLDKLRRLHSLQFSIRNKRAEVQLIRDEINAKCGLILMSDDIQVTASVSDVASSPTSDDVINSIRYAPQLLTMNSLNKMLQDKPPSKVQRQEMIKLKKQIEFAKFRCKLLSQERDKKSVLIRQFKQKLTNCVDENEEKQLNLMENYHQLSKDGEKLKEFRQNLAQHFEIFMNIFLKLQYRRKQLIHQLLFIYPIERIAEKKYTINGIYLPNSDVLADCSDTGLSVALGYITHILTMCSEFLQVPLRYPLMHYGSRSCIVDSINPVLPDREREFPLFTKGKEKMQFTYAVFLLNKNIAQMRWLFFMHTPELKATLLNLLNFLDNCKKEQRIDNTKIVQTTSKDPKLPLVFHLDDLNLFINNNGCCSDAIIDGIRRNVDDNVQSLGLSSSSSLSTNIKLKQQRKLPGKKSNEYGPGLSEILAIPEAFLNKQISKSDLFCCKDNYYCDGGRNKAINLTSKFSNIVIKNENCDNNCSSSIINNPSTVNDHNIDEQGTDMLDPSLNLLNLAGASSPIEIIDSNYQQRATTITTTISRSVNDDECDNKIIMNVSRDVAGGSEPSLWSVNNNKDMMIGSSSSSSSLNEHQEGHQHHHKHHQNKLLEKWLNSSPLLLSSDENVYSGLSAATATDNNNCSLNSSLQLKRHDETNNTSNNSPLTVRTHALLKTKSFNLMKPKH